MGNTVCVNFNNESKRGAFIFGECKGGKMDDLEKIYSKEELLKYLYKYGNIPVILFAKDREGKYIYTSEDTETINWIDGGEEKTVLGKTDLEIQRDKELGRLYYEQDQEILKTGNSTHTYSEVQDGEKKFVFEIKKNPVCKNGEIVGISGIINDVTELVELKRRFEELSYMDTFTQCYNRNYFLKHDYDAPQYLPCTYIMCDCNHLKMVNDKYGHKTGDEYIKNTVQILKLVLPEDGICIRWGGDEFLMIIPEWNRGKCKETIQEINQLQKKKKEIFPYMDIAIGSFVREDIKQSEEESIAKADQAMYEDKKQRKQEGESAWK